MATFVQTSWPPSATEPVGHAVSGVPLKRDRCSVESNSRNGTEAVPYRRRAAAAPKMATFVRTSWPPSTTAPSRALLDREK